MPAAPATFRKLLREIFIKISSIILRVFLEESRRSPVCAHPFVDFIVSLFFKNKMENAGLSLGKNRHLGFNLSVSAYALPPLLIGEALAVGYSLMDTPEAPLLGELASRRRD